MFDQEQSELKRGTLKAWRTLFFALVSLAMYIYVGQKYPGLFKDKISLNFPLEPLRYILYAVAAAELYLIHNIRSKILSSDLSDISQQISRLHVKEQIDLIISKYNQAVIVSIALAESIAIFGWLFFLISEDYHVLYLFVFIGAVAMVFYRPKLNELKKYANSVIAQPNA